MRGALNGLSRALSARAWVVVGAVVLMLLIALVVAVMAWGDAKFREGERGADGRWREASAQLERKAREAGGVADRREADRIEDHAARVAREKEKIDEATAAGDSPLDALFGGV